jgi:FMN-dependent NADH-azoreductase
MKQICERFEKYGDHLLFEPMNEIGYDEIWTPWSGSEADKAKALGYVNDLIHQLQETALQHGINELLGVTIPTGLKGYIDFIHAREHARRMIHGS